MSEALSEALVAEIDVDFPERDVEAKKIIRNYTIATFVPSVLPMPIIDIAIISGIQLKMLHSLSRLYGVKYSKGLGKKAITSLVGSVTPVAMTPLMMSAVQVIPVIGQAAGTISLLILGGASTYAVGKVYVQHFESGGTFLTFDPELVRDYFKEQFAEGKKVVAEARQQQKSSNKTL